DAFVARVSADLTSASPPVSTDLAISQTDAPDPATVGQPLTYTITITNNGPDPATSVVMTDTLPAGATFVSATASQGNCMGTTTVVCAVGSLASAASAMVAIVVTPTQAGNISNVASIVGHEADPRSGNNTAKADTTVQGAGGACQADVSAQVKVKPGK